MNSPRQHTSLRERVINASSWVFGGFIFRQALRLCGNLILTRLLVPELFGVMAIANLLYIGTALISDFGLRQNIVQSKRGDEAEFLNTVWTVQIIRGIVIWFVAIGAALTFQLEIVSEFFPSDSVYSEPILPLVIIAVTFNAVISGLESTKIAVANRKLSFKIITKIEIFSQLCGLIFIISWALVDRTIWALVAGGLFGNSLKVILGHALLSGTSNRLQWDPTAFHEIFHFGKWIFLTSILGFLISSGDRILLGGLIDTKTLGIYVIAFFLVDSLQQAFRKIISDVFYPTLSEVLRNNNRNLKQVYHKLRMPVDLLTLTCAGFLFASGSLIIQFLYDDRYVAAGQMLEILSVALISVRYQNVSNLVMAVGKPQYLALICIARLIPLYVLLPLAFSNYGMIGALWVAGGSALFPLPVIYFIKLRYGIFSLKWEVLPLLLLPVGYLLGAALESIVAPLA